MGEGLENDGNNLRCNYVPFTADALMFSLPDVRSFHRRDSQSTNPLPSGKMQSGVSSCLDCFWLFFQLFCFNSQFPTAVELVHNSAPSEHCTLFHCFRVHGPQSLWIRFVLIRSMFKKSETERRNNFNRLIHSDKKKNLTCIVRKVSFVRRTKYSRKLYELNDCDVRSMLWYMLKTACRLGVPTDIFEFFASAGI
jgi:hypothetical protein